MRSGLLLFLCAGAFAAAPSANQVKLLQTASIQFEQMPDSRQWTARGLGYAFRFENQGTAMRVGNHAMRVRFEGSNASAPFTGLERGEHPTNLFRGNSYAKIENFHRLLRTGIYPGIDLIYYGNGRELEYDFQIAPGADPSRIALRFEGADAVSINGHGDVILTLGPDTLTQRAPSIYQKRASGEVTSVEGGYRIDKDGLVRFQLGSYDRALALVIDPSIFYTTYLAGSYADIAQAVGHDGAGYIYVGGYTYSSDFPMGGYSYSSTAYGNRDIFVTKISTGDGTIYYSTYFGGGADDTLNAMTVDQNGLIYFTGSTDSGTFPLNNAYQSSISSNTHAYVSVLDSNQDSASSLIYSSYFGGTTGNEVGYGIFQNNNYKVYITGSTTSTDFPTAGGYQGSSGGSSDAFISEFDITQSSTASLIFSSYLGNYGQDVGRAIGADASGKIYVTGYTFSSNFPVTANNYRNYSGEGDVFLSVIDPGDSSLVYSTFLGGGTGFEDAKALLVDPNGKWVAVAGYTLSADFPTTQNAYQPVFPAGKNVDTSGNPLASNAFLTVFDLTSLAPGKGVSYSTYFGGFGGEAPFGLTRDAKGRYYLCGYTMSLNLPVTISTAMNSVSADKGIDGFIALLDPSQQGSKQLVYSTYVTGPGSQTVYGIDIDNNGTVWTTGVATSDIFSPPQAAYPTTPTGKQNTFLLGLKLN